MIISNTTPLINFAEIGRMDLLATLFGTLVVPPAVEAELMAKATLFPLAAAVPASAIVRRMSPTDTLLVTELSNRVHLGEAECLTLAMEHPRSLLLLDDLAARELAAANGLLHVGSLGCLAVAKQRGLIAQIKPLLRDLRQKARFWITERLEAKILRDAGEI
jgi:uncharacterized protein